MSQTSVNGFSMNCDVVENILPRDTLFIHGNLGSNAWWVKVRHELESRAGYPKNCRMVAAEWRGCGKTEAPKLRADLNVEKLAMDYIALVKELKMDRPVVVGHSTGGAIATVMTGMEPQLFSHLVLLDPIAPDGVKFTPENIAGFDMMRKDRAICEMVMATTIHQCETQDPTFQKIVDDALSVAPLVWTEIPSILMHGSFDYSKWARATEVPVTLLHGKEDVVLPIEGSRELASLFRQCQFTEVESHGHSLNMENPQKFIDLICGAWL